MKKFFLLLITLIMFYGCRNETMVTIRGKIKDNDTKREYIALNSVDINTTKLIDSTRIGRNGDFRFRLKSSGPDFYQVALSPDNFITLLAEPGEKIDLRFETRILYQQYSVNGSEGSELVKLLDDRLMKTERKLDSLSTIYARASEEPGFDSLRLQLENEYAGVVKAQRKSNIEFVINNISSLAAIKALFQKLQNDTYVLYDQRDLQYLKIVTDSLKVKYPDSRHTKLLVSTFEKEMEQYQARKITAMMDTLPEMKLDAVLKDIDGKKVALSSLKGKYVLLSFWSSGSRECIAENIQLKEFYRFYHRKGFEIYQVNLDEEEETWKAAVRFDELPWISVREEDPSNPKSAILFNVKSLPANFLFDPQGSIIGSNLHGKTLQLKLAQLFNN